MYVICCSLFNLYELIILNQTLDILVTEQLMVLYYVAFYLTMKVDKNFIFLFKMVDFKWLAFSCMPATTIITHKKKLNTIVRVRLCQLIIIYKNKTLYKLHLI